MRYDLNIHYSVEEMEKSRIRVDAYRNYRRADRIPVNFCIVPRYFSRAFGIPYGDVYKSPESQYEILLESARYQMEHIRSDAYTEPVITLHPFFDNVASASHFGGHVEYPENETLHAVPHMKTIQDMIDFTIPEEPDAGLYGTTRQWWLRMKELCAETRVTFDGVPGRVQMGSLQTMALGPHMVAVDLAGTNFYLWCLEEPDLCKEFLGKITQGLIESEEWVRRVDPRPGAYDSFGVAEDSSTIMSPAMYREFTVPYDKILFDRFGKVVRGVHMCGPSQHLHEALVNDLHITEFNIFGYEVRPEKVAKSLGGKTLLWGNINPMLMLSGTHDEVYQNVMHTLEYLGPVDGFMLGDGANVCPGTTVENINALAEGSEAYAAAHPELFSEE